MHRRRSELIFLLGIALLYSHSPTWARIDGADPAHSGGPSGSSANCTECHFYNEGHGRVQLLGTPTRYRAGAVYDLIVRIQDAERVGAGFEISAETPAGTAGNWIVSDAVRTQYAGGQPEYVTHTAQGLADSYAEWAKGGGGFDFPVRWQAPAVDVGAITLFTAGQAVDDSESVANDHYYSTYATIPFATPGDADGDEDLDLHDFSLLQRCLGGSLAEECQYGDTSGDGVVTLSDVAVFVSDADGPTSIVPGAYLGADVVRGGLLYDRWWQVLGIAAPSGRHPLYPAAGIQTGSTTYRCKECHGWDYRGVDGVYGSGPRFTGIAGIYGSTLSPQEVFDLLKGDPQTMPDGHQMGTYGLSDADLWDLTKMSLEGTLDATAVINGNGDFFGNADLGGVGYTFACASCHGDSGTQLNFGSEASPEYVGTLANTNPWEVLHKIRFGQPATPMVATELLGWPVKTAVDIGSFTQTLP